MPALDITPPPSSTSLFTIHPGCALLVALPSGSAVAVIPFLSLQRAALPPQLSLSLSLPPAALWMAPLLPLPWLSFPLHLGCYLQRSKCDDALSEQLWTDYINQHSCHLHAGALRPQPTRKPFKRGWLGHLSCIIIGVLLCRYANAVDLFPSKAISLGF